MHSRFCKIRASPTRDANFGSCSSVTGHRWQRKRRQQGQPARRTKGHGELGLGCSRLRAGRRKRRQQGQPARRTTGTRSMASAAAGSAPDTPIPGKQMAIDFVKERDLAKLRTAFRSFSKRKSRRWNVHGATAGSRHHFGKGGAIPPRRRGHRRNSRPRNMAMATAVAIAVATAI